MDINKRAYEVWQEDLTPQEKSSKLNKEFSKDWVPRTWGQRARGHKSALILEIKADEALAKKHINIMKQQKITTLMKQELHKNVKKIAVIDIMRDAFKEEFNKDMPVKVRKKIKTKGKKLIEIIVADIQYKGGDEEHKHVNNIFSTINNTLEQEDMKNSELRITFLGDDIEGMSAHDSQLFEITKGAVKQTLEISKLLSNGLNDLFSRYPKVEKSVVFVPFSNHGFAYGTKKARYQFPEEDYGLIILDWLKNNLDEGIKIFDVDFDRFLVETDKDIYLHGHQGFMRNKVMKQQVLGVDKNIHEGHLHHLEVMQERNRYNIKYPTARMQAVSYEKMAGYNSKPQISKRISEKGINTISVIDVV